MMRHNCSLLSELVKKDIKIRYHRLSLGFLWTFLSPFFMVIIFYIVFQTILRVKILEAPFLAYLMSAVFTWRFFQDSCMSSVTCLRDNKSLIKEAPFPQYYIPLSIVLANAITFIPSLVIIVITTWVSMGSVSPLIVLLPVVVLVHGVMIAGISTLCAILYLKWHDLKFAMESILTFLFYLTPCFYSLTLVASSFKPILLKIYLCNPLVQILNAYRLCLFSGYYEHLSSYTRWGSVIAIPVMSALGLWGLAAWLYHTNKHRINDYLSY